MKQTNSIKLVYLFRHLADIGGMQRVIIDKMNYLAENGFNVTLITCEQGTHPFPFALSKLVNHIDTNHRFFTLYKYPLLKRLYKNYKMKKKFIDKLQELNNAIEPDFVISSVEPIICQAVCKVHTSAKWLIESHVPMRFTLYQSNLYQTLHFNFIRKIYEHYLFTNIKKSYLVITLTHGDAKDWSRWNKNVYVIPNPVTYYPNKINIPSDNYRILAVGRLNSQKGFDYLIDAFNLIASQCSKWKLEIYGIGELENSLRKQIQSLRLENRIIIHPATNMIYDEYMSSQFYVMSSRYEGFPLVLLEALSCGLPCVSFRCTYGPEDIIKDGINGLLVQDRDIEDLSQKIQWMCNHPKERAEMRSNARKTSFNYRKEKIMPIWIQMFQHILNGTFSLQEFSIIQQKMETKDSTKDT